MTQEPASEEINDFINAAWDGNVAQLESFNARHPGWLDVTRGEPIGWTALMWTARNGNADSVRWLVAHGAQIDARDNNGQTPLMLAAYLGHAAAARVLVEMGADFSAKDNEGKTAIDHARERSRAETVSVLEAALKTKREAEEAVARFQQHMRTVARSGRFRIGGGPS